MLHPALTTVTPPTRREVAAYLAEMLDEFRDMAKQNGMPFEAYMVAMASKAFAEIAAGPRLPRGPAQGEKACG